MLWVYDHYKYVYSFSAGIDFRRQNLTSTDDLCAERIKQNSGVNHNIGIQIKRKELTKAFIILSWKKINLTSEDDPRAERVSVFCGRDLTDDNDVLISISQMLVKMPRTLWHEDTVDNRS